jgi:hypothetical protein
VPSWKLVDEAGLIVDRVGGVKRCHRGLESCHWAVVDVDEDLTAQTGRVHAVMITLRFKEPREVGDRVPV